MFRKVSRRVALAALTVSAAAGTAHAALPFVSQQSTPVYWGQNGAVAVLEIYYDLSATIPVTVVPNIVDLGGGNTALLAFSCGSPIKRGDGVVAYQLNPGNSCYYRIARTGNSVAGTAVMNDKTGLGGNIARFVRGSVEIRDAGENVLTHVEMR